LYDKRMGLNDAKEESMKTHEKDVLLICKKHYDTNKHKNDLEALIAYQEIKCGVCKKYITISDVINFSLLPTLIHFSNTEQLKCFMKDYVCRQPLFYERKKDYNEIIAEKMILFLAILQVKDGETQIIDLSDYDNSNIL